MPDEWLKKKENKERGKKNYSWRISCLCDSRRERNKRKDEKNFVQGEAFARQCLKDFSSEKKLSFDQNFHKKKSSYKLLQGRSILVRRKISKRKI